MTLPLDFNQSKTDANMDNKAMAGSLSREESCDGAEAQRFASKVKT
jgi:hypothetical protein